EIFLGDFPRGAAGAFVITLNRVDRGEDIFHVGKTEQPLAGRQEFAKTRLLGDDGAARRQVTGAAVAKPTCVRAHILVARHGEFSARLLDVGAVPVDVFRDGNGADLSPAVITQ